MAEDLSDDVWRIAAVVIGPHQWDDYAPIPERFRTGWMMNVLPRSSNCSVSDALVENHMWEPAETLAMLHVFEKLPNHMFLDFGANVGYFTKLARLMKLSACAVEGEPATHDVLEWNFRDDFGAMLSDTWIDGRPWRVFTEDNDYRYIVKVDLEGEDVRALFSIEHLAGRVDAILVELSPVFNDSWLDAVDLLYDWGLMGALIPDKQRPPVIYDSIPQLRFRRTATPLKRDVEPFDQRNALFVRPGAFE